MIAKAISGTVIYKKGDVATILMETGRKVKIYNPVLLAGDTCYIAFDRTKGEIKHIWRELDRNATNDLEDKEPPPEQHELDSIDYEELEFSRQQEGE